MAVSTGAMIAAPVMAATATAPTPDTIREHFFEIVASLEMTAQAYAPEGGASAGVLLFTDSAEGSAVAYPADPSAHAAVTVPMAGPANVDVYAPSVAMVFIADPNAAAATALARVPVVSGAQILTAPLSTATAADYAPDVVADSMPEVPTAAATGAAPAPVVLAGEGEGINPPVATATAAVPVPDNVGGSSTVIAMLSMATAEDLVPVVTATSDVPGETAAATAMGREPVIRGDQIQVVPAAATASAVDYAPDVTADSNIDAPVDTATSQAYPPVVLGGESFGPAAIELTGPTDTVIANAWVDLLSPWAVTSGYPQTVIQDGYKIRMGGAGTVTITYQATYVGRGAHTRGARVVRVRDGVETVLGTPVSSFSDSLVRTGASFTDAARPGDLYRLQGYTGDSDLNERRASTGTWLRLNVV